MKKILSLVLAVTIVFSGFTLFVPAPIVAAEALPEIVTVGGVEGSDPLKMEVNNEGSLSLYFWTGSIYQLQYYDKMSWGTNLFFTDDTTGITSHYVSPYYKMYYVPDAASLGYGDLTQSGNTVTCSWLLDNGKMKFEQIVQYTSGNYAVDINFRLTNLSTDVTYSNAKVIHGGDTLFGGEDNATSYYNSSNGMVYVKNPDMTKSGIMGFAGYASSPANAYFAGYYYTGSTQAAAGQLLNQISPSTEDAGYQLQWNQGSLAPGQTWEIKSYTMITEPGAIQVISPSQQSAALGAGVDYTFYVQNFSTESQTITLSASSEHGWSTLVSATPVTIAGSGGSTAVTVHVQVPADAGLVTSDTVTLTVSGTKSSSGSAVTNVMYSAAVDLSTTPGSVLVGTPVTLKANIISSISSTGTVTFYDSGSEVGTAAVSNGIASLPYTPASAGYHPITASYNGDAHHSSATGSEIGVIVTKKTPVLTLSASVDSPGTYPADITYSAVLTDYFGSLSGKDVVITVDGTPHSVSTDADGIAEYTFTPPAAGASYRASAAFSGDVNHNAVSSDTVDYYYNKAPQTTPGISLQNGSAAITYGDSLVNYKAAGSGGESTGGYEYRSDNTPVLSVDSTTGEITVNGAGNAKIYVKHLEDTNYNASAENFVQITVAAKPITVTNVGVMNKIYDGTTDASFSGTPALSGVLSGDAVTLSNGTPTFAGVNFSASPVAVNFTTAFSIDGTDADNYTLIQPDSVTASIGKRPLTVSVNPITIGCGQALPVLGVTVNAAGFVSGETESSLVGFARPAASHTYGSTTELANNKDFAVTYSGGSATDNYFFIYNNTAKITIHPVYIAVGDYQVTGSYGVSASPAGRNKENIIVTPANGYDKISLTGDVWNDSITVSEEALNGQIAFKLKKSAAAGGDGTQTEFSSIYYNLDKVAPIGEITVKENKFTAFMNGITFGLFYKETLDVTITGADTAGTVSSGVSTIEYQKVADVRDYDVNRIWTDYDAFRVTPDEKFIVFAKITDNAGNMTIINSDGTVVYTSSALSRTSVMFDVDESRLAYADVRIALTPDTNTLKQIAFGEEVLIKDTDYTVDGNVVTIMKEYLKTVVSGTISLTFTFNPLGENYVYGDGPATAQLAVTQIVYAQAPIFTTNLSGTKTYSKNEAAGVLQVQAEVDDGGKITYQWYVSSTASAAGTALSGATSASYTPKTDVTGAFYYYVIAVNTNDGASGDREADTVSGTFKVIVNNLELLPPEIGEGAPAATLPGDAKEVLESVLTAADIQKSAEGSNISIRLKITKKDVSQADRDAAALVLGNNTLAEFLDISLGKSIDGIESAVTQTASPIRITMQIPEDMKKDGRIFAIIRIHNGAAEVLSDLDTDPVTFTFETDCFSTYAPVYKDAAAAAGAAKTGEAPPVVPYYVIGAGLLLTAFYLGKKRRERMKEEIAD